MRGRDRTGEKRDSETSGDTEGQRDSGQRDSPGHWNSLTEVRDWKDRRISIAADEADETNSMTLQTKALMANGDRQTVAT